MKKRIHYHFNPETLSYKKIEITLADILFKKILPQSTLALFGGIGIFILATFYMDSPEELSLMRQREMLLAEYEMLSNRIAQANVLLEDLQKRDDNVYRVIFEQQPIPANIRQAGFGGVNRYKIHEGYESSSLMINMHKKVDKLAKQLVIQSKSHDEIINLVMNKEKMLASIPAIQPIAIKDLTRFGSGFGMRFHPVWKMWLMHTGIDLTAPTGTNVYSAGDGEVSEIESKYGGYGNKIVVNHGYGYTTIYAHLSKIIVTNGQKVKRGEVIGLVGNTGTSTSPHLHYEVRIYNRPVNPINFYYNDLTPEEYEKMINMQSSNTHVFELDSGI